MGAPESTEELAADRIVPVAEGVADVLLKKGRVRIYRVAPDGWEFTLGVVEAGTMFGEMALTAQRMREAYAEVAEPSYICILKSEDLEGLVRKIRTWAYESHAS